MEVARKKEIFAKQITAKFKTDELVARNNLEPGPGRALVCAIWSVALL